MSPASRHMHLLPYKPALGPAPGPPLDRRRRSERYASYTHEPPR